MKQLKLIAVTALFIFLFLPGVIRAQGRNTVQTSEIRPVKQDITLPLREIRPYVPGNDEFKFGNENETPRSYPNLKNSLPARVDPVWQKDFGTLGIGDFAKPSFDGIPWLKGCGGPPDCNGAAGQDYYVQVANSAFQVFDKKGNSVLGPVYTNTIWKGLPGGGGGGSESLLPIGNETTHAPLRRRISAETAGITLCRSPMTA